MAAAPRSGAPLRPDADPVLPPHVEVRTAALPGEAMGLWDQATSTIWLDEGLTSVERRCTLVHELVHAERGDVPCGDDALDARQETRVEREAARRLVELDELAAVLRWAADPEQAAEELGVDLDILSARLASLTRAERELLLGAVDGGRAA